MTLGIVGTVTFPRLRLQGFGTRPDGCWPRENMKTKSNASSLRSQPTHCARRFVAHAAAALFWGLGGVATAAPPQAPPRAPAPDLSRPGDDASDHGAALRP